MSLKLSDVDIDADFGELMTVMWAAHEDPVQPFFQLFCPVQHGDRQASMNQSMERMREWDRHDPNAQWLKVEDTLTGKIVGAAWYKIYKENPFAQPEEEIVDWYPDDSSRDFVGQAIAQMDGPREEKATRPQVFLHILFTHPDHRRRGIGSMLVQWGMDKARDLDLEFWLNATPIGKPLYEKFGFDLVQRNPLVPQTDSPDDTWHATARKFSDIVFWTMWLPKPSKIDGKQAEKPWESK